MRVAILAGLFLATTAGAAVAQQAMTPAPRLETRGTGDGILFYNHLSADCVTLVHGFGRNSVWGQWCLPLARIDRGEVEEGGDGVTLRYRCLDGTTCIARGRDGATPNQIDHAISFGSVERARAFALSVGGHKVACGLD